MRKAALAVTALIAGLTAASCHRLIRPATPPFTVTGRVEAIDTDALSLRHKSGQRLRISLAGETAVTMQGRPVTAKEIVAGMRVVVVYRFVGDAAVADEVRLFRGPINYP